ncbi:MFS transporter [Amycolatopsis panacis]|uniref:MFS transporter n=1 Tax=Amycolatopsis panacis TaxID=2340917 RepID=A0A419HJC1_9PSEU|nr:MFS transporter [Amycolatopsis panacis]RJQ75875.1 MFS transporter [Amycolatopsis panacis]
MTSAKASGAQSRTGPLPAAFHRLLTAAAISGTGDGLRYAALPLLAASLTDRPSLVALVTVAGRAPWLLLGLTSGVVADRLNRRTLMWSTDFFRAALTGGFALVLAFGGGSPPALVVFAFLLGCAQVLFDTAAMSFLPAVIPDKRQLGPANGRLAAAQGITSLFLGPPIGGVLFGLSVVSVFAIDAASFLLAAALVLTLRSSPAARPAAKQSITADLATGLRWLWRNRELRDQTAVYCAISLITGVILAVFVLYVRGELELGGFGYGVLTAFFAVGNLLMAWLAPILRIRLGQPALLIGSVVAITGSLVLIGVVQLAATTALALFVFGCAGTTWLVITLTLRQEIVPDNLLARVTSCYRTVGNVANPVGALLGGLVTQLSSTPVTFLLCGGVMGAVSLGFHRSLRSD